jgi:alanine racemase
MDASLADVTDVPGVEVGDQVVLFGRQGEEQISIDEIAAHSKTISYEITSSIGKRVRRVYV